MELDSSHEKREQPSGEDSSSKSVSMVGQNTAHTTSQASTPLSWLQRLLPFQRRRDQRRKQNKRDIAEDYRSLFARFHARGGVPFTLRDFEGVKSRQQYGPMVIIGYLVLVAIQISVPLILWFIVANNQPTLFSSGLRDIKDFVIAISASLSGVSGLVGFVVGHYFRERAS